MKLDINKKNYELIIVGKGIGSIVEFGLSILVIIAGISIIVLNFFCNYFVEFGYVGYISAIVLIYIGVFTLIKATKKNKVIFTQTNFLTLGGDDLFKSLDICCSDVINYNVAFKNLTMAIQLQLKNGGKKYFPTTHFTKKQIIQILLEIKKRGGLLDNEVNLDDYCIRKRKRNTENNVLNN